MRNRHVTNKLKKNKHMKPPCLQILNLKEETQKDMNI